MLFVACTAAFVSCDTEYFSAIVETEVCLLTYFRRMAKAISFTYFECVSVALVIKRAMHIRQVFRDLSGSTVFLHIIS
jgi:hypothetical protein